MNASQIVVGTPVIYWAVIDQDSRRSHPTKTEITSEVWALGSGEQVCKVKGITGGVAISHLDPISPGSLMAARLQGCKDVSDQDFKDESTKFFGDRGVQATFY
ncbi:hypothetical protein [Fibrella forsythiae]|uniref:Uncharacterized protein n=1 Tax=Fibrella forsythiae TaxID=2817061 RepID=A0ABS3JDE7_9BACT|nr:hypothetical protein [Fibrella forsythiae]MBO0947473.1 hypothetical protein [Fibrella forsythiae]